MKSFCDRHQQQTAGLGPVHTNPAIFETAFFLHESAIRPQETIKSAIRKDILLKPPLQLETGLRPPPHESGQKNIYIIVQSKKIRLV